MNKFKLILLILLKPKGYNNPTDFAFLWNQWLHQGYLWGWYSYDFYSNHTKEPFVEIEEDRS